MKQVLLALILFATTFLVAVDFFPAGGQDVQQAERQNEIYYHNNSQDQHWYGSQRWAVRFVANEQFSSLDSLNFRVDGFKVFLPQIGNSDLHVSFWENGLPETAGNDSLGSVTIALDQQQIGWNEAEWNIPLEQDTIWMVVDYPTFPTQEIAASNLDGTHSYFYEDGIFKNMAAQGFNSEFLFSIYGEYLFDFSDDIAVSDLQLIAQQENIIHPAVQITNNSVAAKSQLQIAYQRTAPPGAGFIKSDDYLIEFAAPLQPAENRLVELTDLADTLLVNPAMYQFSLTLVSETDQFAENNLSTATLDNFADYSANFLIENFVTNDQYESEQIWQYQADNTTLQESSIINYFPYSSDLPYYTSSALQRFHYYHLGGVPASIIEGTNRFLGYDDSHNEMFPQILADNQQHNFASLQALTGTYNQLNGTINFELILENDSTYVFDTFLFDTKLNLIIVEDYPQDGEIFGSIYRADLGSYRVTELAFRQEQIFELGFNTFSLIQPLTATDDFSNCKIYYWLQNEQTNQLFLRGEIPFDQFASVSAENDLEQNNPLLSFTNPSFSNQSLQIKVAAAKDLINPQIDIYNIKGQKIATQKHFARSSGYYHFKWDGRNKFQQNLASGIYLMQLRYGKRSDKTISKKLLRIRR